MAITHVWVNRDRREGLYNWPTLGVVLTID